MEFLIMFLLFITALFLILLVLVQRGRGGGLAGAFGGMGGQSAFGTKAGDLFTRITIGVAAFWIVLCAASVVYFSEGNRNIISQDLGKSAAPIQSSGQNPETLPGTSSPKGGGESKSTAPAGAAPVTPEDKSSSGESSAPATTAPTTTTPATEAPAGSPASSQPSGATEEAKP
ncbi:MAG TPA: preprotein translocase subunit SecG [Pirellulales bacterium]|jgi:preprotein translocase subunit SecG|nr:preprotein translocase subunit SecG [Pirellulales bacterium]